MSTTRNSVPQITVYQEMALPARHHPRANPEGLRIMQYSLDCLLGLRFYSKLLITPSELVSKIQIL
ncbi:uncharacterized protein CLUP02_13146 [Colletotrichum lupini]|uniref:Uncharacterized protein n=1 Tax=Colletotrichum lupini TaxID=145971 RepID=A0A9Q8T1U6_9PEZI|nr:uncharacterized protein CLUP02_13146 [Colletotrichum lupini]UQC87628.1 hypothetical protein CLUP02_13146 [Colletotrichum lupini]